MRLLIVDSVTAHFRPEYVGRGTLADRQQKRNKHLHDLMRFRDLNNALILVPYQVMAKPYSFLEIQPSQWEGMCWRSSFGDAISKTLKIFSYHSSCTTSIIIAPCFPVIRSRPVLHMPSNSLILYLNIAWPGQKLEIGS